MVNAIASCPVGHRADRNRRDSAVAFRRASRGALGAAGERIIQRVEKTGLMVVGTPVYRLSYTGALKHLFDRVDYRALAGKTVLLAAAGGSSYHGLVLEHQLRPLFGFFGAVTVDLRLRRARRFRPGPARDESVESTTMSEIRLEMGRLTTL